MLLDDLGRNGPIVFGKINKLLMSQYGVSISEDTTADKLEAIHSQLLEHNQQLKVAGNTANDCPTLSKNLLMLEGIHALMEKKRMDESMPAFVTSNGYLRVVKWLTDFVVRNTELGDDFDDAMRQAMKEYNSCKYRFPASYVENDVMQRAQSQTGIRENTFESKTLAEAQATGEQLTKLAKVIKSVETPEQFQMAEQYADKLMAMARHQEDRGVMAGFEDSMDLLYSIKADLQNKAAELGIESTVFESLDECPGQGNELSSFLDPEDINNVKAFIIIPQSDMDPGARGKVHDYFSAQGQEPQDDDDWMYQSLVDSFGPSFQGDLDEAEWGDVLDKSGRYKMNKPTRKAPELSLVSKDADAYEQPQSGHAQHNMKRLSPQRKTSMREDFVRELRHLLESEVGEAEIIIAVKGIGKTIQEMIEKIGRLTNEDLPPLSDQVRDTYGENTATQFQTNTSTSLAAVMDALYQAKDDVDQTVQNIATGNDMMADTDMDVDTMDDMVGGMGDDMDTMDAGMDDDFADDGLGLGDDLGMDDDFGAEEIGLEDEPLGRAKKESAQNMKKKIAEMKRIIAQTKALKETA